MLVFEHSLNYVEVVERGRIDDVVEFGGRHNVVYGMYTRWKTVPLNSESCCSAYKEMVVESQD